MGDKIRWRHGDRKEVKAAVDSATVIEIGDLLWQHRDDAKPASDLDAWRPKEPGVSEMNQKAFAELFLGVAMQYSREGSTEPIRVSTTGVFEFDVPSEDPINCELGDLVGVRIIHYSPPDSPSLANQQVAKVIASQYAIARVAKFEHKPVTSVLIDIRSTVMTGGVK